MVVMVALLAAVVKAVEARNEWKWSGYSCLTPGTKREKNRQRPNPRHKRRNLISNADPSLFAAQIRFPPTFMQRSPVLLFFLF